MPRGKKIPTYVRRQRNLEKLGFRTYSEYLASDLWKAIRSRVLQRDNGICRRCKGRAWQVHHRKYVMKAMDGTNIGLLVSVCGPCHEFMEWDGERKTGITGANHRIKVRPAAAAIVSNKRLL
jgi:5-methylcytosine-specific restriction endonuclease McrA